jgi:uncharacterized protein YecE (DUF72 family)
MLAHYATQFDTVEADSTYYRAPGYDLVQRWSDVTPPGFALSSKLPLSCYLGDDPREPDPATVMVPHDFKGPLGAHLAALTSLGDKAGPVVRNREYLHADTLAVLKKHHAALVLNEVRGMPHPAVVAEKLDLLTTDFFYARLIGDRSKVERISKTFDRVVIDQSASLGRWAHLVRTMASSADGFVYANNHFAGHGPATIRELRELVDSPAAPPRR